MLYFLYALRKDFDLAFVSVILASFSIGAIIIVYWSIRDKIGRRKVIISGLLAGSVFF